MVGTVAESLQRLDGLSEDNLTMQVVRELAQMSHGALWRSVHVENLDYKNKSAVAALIERNRPVIEEWPNVSNLETALGVESHVPCNWYRTKRTQRKTGAQKVLNRVYFSPEWFSRVEKKVEKNGAYIPVSEAAGILGLEQSEIYGWDKALGVIQPAGKGTLRFCPKARVLKFKEKLAATEGLLTSEQVATELGALVEDVRDVVPHKMRHPVTRRFLYDALVVSEYKNSPITCTPLSEILENFEKNYCLVAAPGQTAGVEKPKPSATLEEMAALKETVGYLLHRKYIPSEKVRGKDSAFYIPGESEGMIKHIYVHAKNMRDNKVTLVRVPDAAKTIGITENQLNTLLSRCGKEYDMSASDTIWCALSTVDEERKVTPRPVVPFVKWTPLSPTKYLMSKVVDDLAHYVRIAEAKAPTCRVYDGYWYKRLAQAILNP